MLLYFVTMKLKHGNPTGPRVVPIRQMPKDPRAVPAGCPAGPPASPSEAIGKGSPSSLTLALASLLSMLTAGSPSHGESLPSYFPPPGEQRFPLGVYTVGKALESNLIDCKSGGAHGPLARSAAE